MTQRRTTSSPARKYLFFANREVRRVPLDWKHPTDGDGHYVPLSERDPSSSEDDPESEMPDFTGVPPERMGLCAYETTTEGTPISPVFPDTLKGRFALAAHCGEHATVFADQRADVHTWSAILFGEAAAVVDITTKTISFLDDQERQKFEDAAAKP